MEGEPPNLGSQGTRIRSENQFPYYPGSPKESFEHLEKLRDPPNRSSQFLELTRFETEELHKHGAPLTPN
jgi:hypothetical protein